MAEGTGSRSAHLTYKHCYEDGRVVDARLYPNALLADFRAHFHEVWLPTRCEAYFTREAAGATAAGMNGSANKAACEGRPASYRPLAGLSRGGCFNEAVCQSHDPGRGVARQLS